ncbi:MAG: flagellar basal-body rod protein FlgG [Clostridia bacterium]|jgi:flagellar basal-body rod protein FlgG|nr:flagellar basal-body rod protein FlgG [Clostridia bacterium]
MIGAFKTSTAGMKNVQAQLDTIANNIANVNTASYKKQGQEFKDFLYESIEKVEVDKNKNSEVKPSMIQIGRGSKIAATRRSFEVGNITQTSNKFDFAIDGDGFFEVITTGGERMYTRDGRFKTSTSEETGETALVTAEGYPIVDEEGEYITIPEEVNMSTLTVDGEGKFLYKNTDGEMVDTGIVLRTVLFKNNQGLEAKGDNLYKKTLASGEPITEADENTKKGEIKQGFVEMSNVKVVEEMVNLITAQRAYELNSKVIQAADEMLSQVNNLRR